MIRETYGYAGRVLHVDLSSATSTIAPLDPCLAAAYIGGRGFNMRVLYDLTGPGTSPRSPENPLIFGVGPLVGTLVPGASRFNASGKSPQTGLLGDSNAGGFFGPELKFAGYDQIVITGRSDRMIYLLIHGDRVEIHPAEHLRGLEVAQTDEAIRAELADDRFQVAVVGPSAEAGVVFSGIFCNHARAAARTGMGALMAGKNLKAIAVRGDRPVRVADPRRFEELLSELDRRIFGHPEYTARTRMGTTKLVTALNDIGSLATRHFQTGFFESAGIVSGERVADTCKVKSKACFACTIPCSRFLSVTEGAFAGVRGEGPEFEGLAGFTSRIGVSDLSAGLAGADMCNRYGADVITASECIAFSMECMEAGMLSASDLDGLDLHWGNAVAALKLLEKILTGTGCGRLFTEGVPAFARWLGGDAPELAMHVKGLEIFQADPRGIKGYALGVSVASRGGDHLRSEPSFEFSGDADEALRRYGHADAGFRLKYHGKGRLVKDYEERSALSDMLGVCKNTLVNMEVIDFGQAAELLSAVTGRPFDGGVLQQAAERLVNLERCYLVREGVSRADDRLPRRFLEEPLPAECGESAGSVVELEPMLDEYYAARGWDPATGHPLCETLARLGLQTPGANGKAG